MVLVGITIISIRLIRKAPYFAVGWFWYLGTLVPVIGIVQVGGQAMADRYAYIPLIGIFIIVAWGVPELISKWRYKEKVLSIFSRNNNLYITDNNLETSGSLEEQYYNFQACHKSNGEKIS